MPRIFVEGKIYCFRCAKPVVKDGQYSKLKVAQHEYLTNLASWEEQQDKFKALHAKWISERSQYIAGHLPKFLALKATLVILCLWTFSADAHFLIPVVILSLIVHYYVKSKKEEALGLDFTSAHREPSFLFAKPTEPSNINVTHFPVLLGNEITYSKEIIREEILKRDNYVCQNCDTKKSPLELEVHHVVPKKIGGVDSPYNLITLCKYCHDRETWYGHIRIYPTTIKEEKSKRRTRR